MKECYAAAACTAAACAVLLASLQQQRRKRRRRLRDSLLASIPGPGGCQDEVLSSPQAHEHLRAWHEIYGRVVYFRAWGSDNVSIADASELRRAVAALPKSRFDRALFGELHWGVPSVGSVARPSDSGWRTRHGVLARALSAAAVRSHLGGIQEAARELLAVLRAAAVRREPVDVDGLFLRAAIDANGAVALGGAFGALRGAPDGEFLARDVQPLLAEVARFRMGDPLRKWRLWNGEVRRHNTALRRLHQMARRVLEAGRMRTRAVAAEGTAAVAALPLDVVGELVALRRSKPTALSEKEALADIVNMLLAYDATGHTLAFTAMLVSRDNRVLRRLREELDGASCAHLHSSSCPDACGDGDGDIGPRSIGGGACPAGHGGHGGCSGSDCSTGGYSCGGTCRRENDLFTLAQLSEMPYLEACIKESMRLFPVVANGTVREVDAEATGVAAMEAAAALEEGADLAAAHSSSAGTSAVWEKCGAAAAAVAAVVAIPGAWRREVEVPAVEVCGMRIPVGTLVHVPFYSLFLDPTTFSEPFAFLPERWLTATGDSAPPPPVPPSYVPFSWGIRRCVGQNLAWLEMKILLAEVIRRFSFGALDDECLNASGSNSDNGCSGDGVGSNNGGSNGNGDGSASGRRSAPLRASFGFTLGLLPESASVRVVLRRGG